jgi:hypothetical protein
MFKLIIIILLAANVLSMEGVVELTDANFDQELGAENKFWLVMFSASWVISLTNSVDIVHISNQK